MACVDKLYIVVRGDLPVGLQAAQAVHAAREFAAQHAELERAWFAGSKTLVVLQAPDVWKLAKEATESAIPCALNFEPDLGGKLTAVAFGPSAKKLLRELPLLGTPSAC